MTGPRPARPAVVRPEKYLNLVRSWVSKRYPPGADRDDLIQQGALALMRAAKDYDPAKGTFATYAYGWIRAYVGAYVKDKTRVVRIPRLKQELGGYPHAISLDTNRKHDGSGETLLESVPSPGQSVDEEVEDRRDLRKLEDALRQLPPIKERLLRLRLSGQSARDVGEKIGVADVTVLKWEKALVQQLQETLGGTS